jgi:hypothetical protein
MDKKEKLNELVKKLVEAGDDREELGYWQTIFDDLNEIQQSQLLLILEKEWETLEKNKE